MKGHIICGYPGVGKSAVAGWNNCIDFESSNFSYQPRPVDPDSGNFEACAIIPIRTVIWAQQYCPIAIELASQGFTVLTSTHRPVIEYFKACPVPENVAKPIIFAPSKDVKNEWLLRLTDRYSTTGLDKDWRALRRFEEHFDEDISYLENCGLKIYHPDNMDYDFKEFVLSVQAKE